MSGQLHQLELPLRKLSRVTLDSPLNHQYCQLLYIHTAKGFAMSVLSARLLVVLLDALALPLQQQANRSCWFCEASEVVLSTK